MTLSSHDPDYVGEDTVFWGGQEKVCPDNIYKSSRNAYVTKTQLSEPLSGFSTDIRIGFTSPSVIAGAKDLVTPEILGAFFKEIW